MEKIFSQIEAFESEITETLSEIVSYPAVNPSEGGLGEMKRAEYLIKKLKRLGITDLENHICKDESGNNRPNIIAKIKGKSKQRLWIVSHMDIVPPGDISLWETDPYKAKICDGKIYGRGTCDNGTALVASIYAILSFVKCGIVPKYEINLCFVANEETGSIYGIEHLIKEKLFRKDDLIIVPDMVSEDGSFIEIAEKSIFWIEFTVKGIQSHASLPHLGKNATRAANELAVKLDEALHQTFPEENNIFSQPKCSTFEPTRRFTNVKSVNIIPAIERFAFDCRVLPGINKEEIEKVINYVISKTEKKHGVKVEYKYLQANQAAPVTDPNAKIVRMLSSAIEEVLKVTPKTAGVGGGTCAAFFRNEGIPAVVWGLGDKVEHMPNEYTKITDLIGTAKVLAYLMGK